jgi:hypothetical protein
MISAMILIGAMLHAPPPQGMTKHETPTWASVRVTFYQPHQKEHRPWLDSQGGGPNAGWTGQHLEDYHCATGGTIKLGTKLWVGAPVNRMLLAVDGGSAVRGLHIDVCIPDPNEYKKMCNKTGSYNVWKLGKMNKKQARSWKPYHDL